MQPLLLLSLLLSSLILQPWQALADNLTNGPARKVGLILPLSGVLAEYGDAAKNGIELARKENPELFSNLTFVYEDSQWDPKLAVSAFQKLKATPGVFVIYNWGNPTTAAIAPLAEAYKMPLIGMAIDSKIVQGLNYVIRSTNPPDIFARKLSEYFKLQGYHKIGVVLTDISYTRGMYEALAREIAPDQTIEIVSSHSLGDADFKSTIPRIRQAKYDAVGVFLGTGQVSLFYRQLKQQGLQHIPTFGTDFFESTTEIKDAEGAMEGAVYPHLDSSKDFAEKYLAQNHNDYQLAYAGNAFDVAMLIGRLFNQPSDRDASPEAVMQALKSPQASGFGVGGPYKYMQTPEGDSYFQFPAALKMVKQGGFVSMDSTQ